MTSSPPSGGSDADFTATNAGRDGASTLHLVQPSPLFDLERLAKRHGLGVFYVREFDRPCLLARQAKLILLADDLTPHEADQVARDLLQSLHRRPLG